MLEGRTEKQVQEYRWLWSRSHHGSPSTHGAKVAVVVGHLGYYSHLRRVVGVGHLGYCSQLRHEVEVGRPGYCSHLRLWGRPPQSGQSAQASSSRAAHSLASEPHGPPTRTSLSPYIVENAGVLCIALDAVASAVDPVPRSHCVHAVGGSRTAVAQRSGEAATSCILYRGTRQAAAGCASLPRGKGSKSLTWLCARPKTAWICSWVPKSPPQ